MESTTLFPKLSAPQFATTLALFSTLGIVVACSSSPKVQVAAPEQPEVVVSTDLDSPPRYKNMDAGMHAVGEGWDRLSKSRDAGWVSITGMDPIDPVEEAGSLADIFRDLQRTQAAQDEAEMREWLIEAAGASATIQNSLKAGDKPGAEAGVLHLMATCQKCHDAYL